MGKRCRLLPKMAMTRSYAGMMLQEILPSGRLCRAAAAARPGGSPMDAQVGGAPVAPEAVKAAADAAKSAPTSFAPSGTPKPSSAGTSVPSRSPAATAGVPKAQPTAVPPSTAELEKAAVESRISQGAGAR